MSTFLPGPINKQYHEIAQAELEAAIVAEHKGKKFKPMKFLALLLITGAITDGERRNLAAFMRGDHRRKRGERSDRDFNRQCDLDRVQRYLSLIQQGMKRIDAIPELAEIERIHERKIEESIARGINYLEEDRKELELRFLELKFEKAQIEKERERMDILAPFMIPPT